MVMENVSEIINKNNGKNNGLISMLEDIQADYGYLPEKALKIVAEKTGSSLVDIYGVATFYKSFSLKPRGKHLVAVCLGTACHVRGGIDIANEFERQLKIKAGNTTPDKKFTLETVACLGACALGPIVMVDGYYFTNVRVVDVAKILERARNGLDTVEVEKDGTVFPIDVSCARCNHNLMDDTYLIDGKPSIKVTMSFERKHGWLRLSGLYGSFTSTLEYPVPKNTVINLFCPHCHSELKTTSTCSECGAPMIPMIVRGGGGMLHICSRYGCKWHMLDLEGVNI
jgi:NADH-quinone oxidoreductase subunit E